MGAILDNLIKDHGVTLEQAKLALSKWKIEPLMFRDKQIGEIMFQNHEAHFAIDEQYRLKIGRKQMMTEVVDDLLSKHDFLVTKLFKHDKTKRLIELFGFKKTHEDNQYEYFWLDKETRNDRYRNTKT